MINIDPKSGLPICIRGHIREVGRRNCRECERAASLRWINKDRARSLKLQRERRSQESKEKQRERQRAEYARNPDRFKKSRARYLAKNPEKVRERKRRWAIANRDKVRDGAAKSRAKNHEHRSAQVRNRRAKQRNAGGRHTAKDIAVIAEAQGHKCAYCRANLRKVKRHVDHIMPIALGGSNDRSNLQLLCVPCNLSKQAKHPIEFAQSKGLLL